MATYRDGEENLADDEIGRFVPPFGIGGMCIAFEKCPLCFTTRRPFTCERCLENGDFSHSTSKTSSESETESDSESERYCEKLDRLQRLRSEKDKLLSKLANRLAERNSVAEKQWEVSLMKGRLEWTQKAIQDGRAMVRKDKDSILKSLDELRAAKIKRDEHNKKVLKIQKYLEHIRTNIDSRKESLEEKNDQLRTKRQDKVQQLLHYVFPITEIQHAPRVEEAWQEDVRLTESEAEDKSEEDDLVAALAEARRTSYVRGRWVETINNGEAHYSIVHPHVRVPANGDYSAYIACTLTSESDVPDPDAELDLHNPGHQVSAALCYTAQLVAHLANTLDVSLVRKVHFSRFCKSELSLRQFSSAVEKLNCSVLFLCFSQAIPPDKLHPHYTLRNLITMVDSKQQEYGRTSDFEVHSDLLLATLTTPNMTSMLSGSGSESQHDSPDDDDGASIGSADQEEWETVPTSLPLLPQAMGGGSEESSHTPSPPEPSPSMMSASNLPQAPGGLVSSAVASVASLWRTATSQLEKR